MKVLSLFLILYLQNSLSTGDAAPLDSTPNYGQALFLTPYIEAGRIAEGQAAARVQPLKRNVTSYSGFFTVDKRYNSSLFFWYFPSEADLSAPVLLWLQGGAGASSLVGVFLENGPFYVKPKRGLGSRKYYWSQVFNVVYIDNPVGAGFSFTDSDSGYARNENDVADNLYSAVQQFLDLFPNLRKNEFYVTGESYAGKYIPALANAVHNKNPGNPKKIYLKGIAIGNGFIDPASMLDRGNYLYQIGLLDSIQQEVFTAKEKKIVKHIQENNFSLAFSKFDELMMGDLTPGHTTIFKNMTGFTYYFNYLHDKDDSPFGNLETYLSKDVVRRSIHTGNLTFHSGEKVEILLKNDFMQSVKGLVESLVENYKVLLYSGQLDLIVPYPMTANFLSQLKWSGSDYFKIARRNPWIIDGNIAGYVRKAKRLTEVLVRNAGHMVPGDQPLWALDMMSRFVYNKNF